MIKMSNICLIVCLSALAVDSQLIYPVHSDEQTNSARYSTDFRISKEEFGYNFVGASEYQQLS